MIGRKLSHYRLVEKIGAGGMGVVYRAHDEQLDRDVAIKVLRPGSLADEVARKRFRKEALSLARLNHPNIATVHDFGTEGDTDFLVTEYIAGITLDTRLTQSSLPPAEVMRLGIQLADGLAAAHQQGVIHRDLKPGNLRLTADGRLKILDFGLAQLMPQASEEGMTKTVTQTQDTSGTLPYMAPEQLAGQSADARTDIWSAGAVLYEMSTGKRPFVQATNPLLINAILNQDPESLVKTGLPTALQQIILKALDKNPQRRYQTAREIAVDLERMTPTTGSVPVQPKKKSGMLIGALAALFIAGLAVTIIYTRPSKRGSAPAAAQSPVGRRRTVAVLGFKNLSGNPDKLWISTALSEMLTTELSQGDQLRLIPGESVAQMKVSMSLPDADSYSQQTLSRIHQNLGSDHVVVGSYLLLGNGVLRLDMRLQDANAGETLLAVSEKGSEAEIDTLVSKAGNELRAKLGAGALSDAQTANVRASLPSTPEAARLYSEGLQRLRVFNALAATDSLQRASVLDPNHAPTHAALAEALSILGYDERSKEQARKALELSANFSPEEKLLIEGRAHEILSQPTEAVESYRALWALYPDNVDYALFLIRAQTADGHGNDAEATLAQARKLKSSDVDNARIDLAEANIAASVSDFKRKQSVAARAAATGRAVGANELVAQALQLEAEAWERMGQSEKSIQLSNQARELYLAAGDRRGAARTQLMIGDVLYDQGQYEGAKQQYEGSLPVFQQIGARRSIRAAMERIANVFYNEGKLREAEARYQKVLEFDQQINDPFGLASDYGNIANAMDGLGDLAGSLKMQQQALAAFNSVGDRRGASDTLNNLANLFIEMGNLPEGKKNYDAALAMNREIGYKRAEPYPVNGMGDALFAEGDLAGARRQYESAMELAKQLNEGDLVAQVQVSMAALALAEKKFDDGVQLARQAVDGFEKSNTLGNIAWANAILARNYLGAGKLADARVASEKAMSAVQKTTGQTPRYEAVLADARVKAAQGKVAEARRELDTALASTRKFGFRIYELQVRLAIAEIATDRGTAKVPSDLAAVEQDARRLGALLVANQAQALQQGK